MYNPIATYRIQFHKDFNFNDFSLLIPYLQKLGISTLYASPIFKAVPGSTHGYDVTDPQIINPEIGSMAELKVVSKTLSDQGIGWLQDIVPNHMAYHPGNLLLMDILEKGQLSLFEHYFDQGSSSDFSPARIMVPFLGKSLEEVITSEELTVFFEQEQLKFKYFDVLWPLNIRSYTAILSGSKKTIPAAFRQLVEQVEQLHQLEDKKAYALAVNELKSQLAALYKQKTGKKYVEDCLAALNNDKKVLKQVADEQEYRLCSWQETDVKINYRRFFTVNGLICMNVQHDDVFQESHQLIGSLISDGCFQGLRIDHIDGLFDPEKYLKQLRKLAGAQTYIVVEKILEQHEKLPGHWPIEGTTGYEYLSQVNNLFTNQQHEKKFDKFYRKLVGKDMPVAEQIREKKRFILENNMAGELDNLCAWFYSSDLADQKRLKKVSIQSLKAAIGAFLVECPVYRYYASTFPLAKDEALEIKEIFTTIRTKSKVLLPALDLLENAFLNDHPKNNGHDPIKALHFFRRCMQFSGPLMAKGVEDTLMYTNFRFIGHNEVGDAVESFGVSVNKYHQLMAERQEKWPLSLNATSSHDTKRGEDVRTRLNVLTDIPGKWFKAVKAFRRLNKALKSAHFPDANDEYFIYQTLIGTYPMPGQEDASFSDRLQQYLEKALREAKNHSNWTQPNADYEHAVKTFAVALLDKSQPFWGKFEQLHQQVADLGIMNSLAQVLLKFTSPGVPDVYQGCELWDLSLVDPDNRRPVDYGTCIKYLDDLNASSDEEPLTRMKHLWENRYGASIKMWLVHTLLEIRKQDPDTFSKGAYLPLKVKGKYNNHLIAFARRHERKWYVVVAPLHLAKMAKKQHADLCELDWADTHVVLPAEMPIKYTHLLSNMEGRVEQSLLINNIFKGIPLAVLKFEQPVNQRAAGLLMHVTSLPSEFGVGDFGPHAYAFADFLRKSCQKYWQLLPLGPTELRSGHSPYSALSGMAGNPLLISPDLLVRDGLLHAAELESYREKEREEVDFHSATTAKDVLFEKAWLRFDKADDKVDSAFIKYCEKEAYWLNDFAVYVLLKQIHDGKPWYEWADIYKFRAEEALRKIANQHQRKLEKIKWLQFTFSKQWQDLKNYANGEGVQIIGDLPIYVAYDSVDVWSHMELFCLDKTGKMEGIAGVPPDYFNADGQLWGMPVFRWDVLKQQGYDWWLTRIRKNMELYDLVRLDHFRAFSSYWEVPAGEKTAINGEWKAGPGAAFFHAIKKVLGHLPFIAEDLGEIDNMEYALRDGFNLPGMKVLQFAFGDDLSQSPYAPHNFSPDFVVYPGTHDNNTTRGWFRQDISKKVRKQLHTYTGQKVKDKNVHEVFLRMALASTAKTAVVAIQDLLGLDENARMNTPASISGNWLWKLKKDQLTVEHEKMLRNLTRIYNRD
ncbi:MAG: malto-oligosyltrehalose synthase [Sphingobacteriaceae bacterium]